MRVVITGGGTGGHISPGLAIAEALIERHPDTNVLFVGGSGLEQTLVPKAGWPFVRVSARQVSHHLSLQAVGALAILGIGGLQAISILGRFRPQVVVATGGYAAAPIGGAAILLRIPLIVQEQNLVPGTTNRVLGRWARRVSVPHDTARQHFPGKAVVTGVPIRKTALAGGRDQAARRFGLAPEQPTLLVLGGSQGAHSLNAAVVGMLPLLPRDPPLQILHQTGTEHAGWVRDQVARLGSIAADPRYVMVPYIDAIGDAYAAADLVLSRAGFGTLAELTANGRPAILVPYPFAAGAHQEPNARLLERAGAARVLPDRELSGATLAATVSALVRDPARLQAMAAASRALGRIDAAARVADLVLEVGARTASVQAQ